MSTRPLEALRRRDPTLLYRKQHGTPVGLIAVVGGLHARTTHRQNKQSARRLSRSRSSTGE
jgi:hypothetical protein